MADIFSKSDAVNLLRGKHVIFLGDSNMRALYKDVVYLLNRNALIGTADLKRRLEPLFMGDKLLEGDKLTRGRDYVEIRQFKNDSFHLDYYFITRCYNKYIEEIASKVKKKEVPAPDIIFMNSVLWDVTRWGPDGVSQYKDNMVKLMKMLKASLPPDTLFVWTTAPPVSQHCYGGTLIKQIEFLRHTLRFEVMEANMYARDVVGVHGYHVLDLHFYFTSQMILRAKDGVHWHARAVRYMTNLLLTHIALSFDHPLPGNFHGPLLDEMTELMKLPGEESLPIALPRLPPSLVLKDQELPTTSPQKTAIVKSPLCKPPLPQNPRRDWKKKTRQIKRNEKENVPPSFAMPKLKTHELKPLLSLPYENMQSARQLPPLQSWGSSLNLASFSSTRLNPPDYRTLPEFYYTDNTFAMPKLKTHELKPLLSLPYQNMQSARQLPPLQSLGSSLNFASSSSSVNPTNYKSMPEFYYTENRDPLRSISIHNSAELLTQHHRGKESALIQKIENEMVAIQEIENEIVAIQKKKNEMVAIQKIENEIVAIQKKENEMVAIQKIENQIVAIQKKENEMVAYLHRRNAHADSLKLEQRWWGDDSVSPLSSSSALQYSSRFSRRAMPY